MSADEPAGGRPAGPFARDLRHAHVGSRVVVRHRLPEGGLTDVLGVLERWDDGALHVRDRHGAEHVVDERAVVGGKPVPPPPARR